MNTDGYWLVIYARGDIREECKFTEIQMMVSYLYYHPGSLVTWVKNK
jgi:hypothetical protein